MGLNDLFRRLRRAALAAAFAGFAFPASAQQQVMLKQVSPPASYHPAGRAVDVLGVAPGMTPDAVRAVLAKIYGNVAATQENLGLEYRGVTVSTQNYVTRMSARKGADDITVWFGTPTTGNGVVQVTRQVTYFKTEDAPLLTLARKALAEQYGTPAIAGPAVGTGEIELMAWSYKGDQPATCAASSCRADLADGLTVADMTSYQRAVRRGHELTIVAMLLASIADPTRASSIVTTVSDTATKLRTLDSAIKQMQEGASPARKPDAKPGKPGR